MKKGKELKINKFKNYKIVHGSVDNRNTKAIYIRISAWGEPVSDDGDIAYTRVVKNIEKKIKQTLYNMLANDDETRFMEDRSIVDLDMRVSGIKYGKRSFANCDITLFLKDEIPVNSDLIKPELDDITTDIINTLESNKSFTFYKRK